MDIYCDIHPFTETAISLQGTPAETNYINANKIQSIYGEGRDNNLIIATQGPIASSLRNWWKTVHQENVGRVVTLVQQIPGDCAEYFPDHGEIMYGDMQVKYVTGVQEGNYVAKREF